MVDGAHDDRVSVVVPRPRRLWPFIVAMTIGSIVLGLVVAGLAMTFLERQPAVKILTQNDAGQVAQNDGRILIFTKIDRTRSCKIETTHWLFTKVNHDGDIVRAYIPIAEDGPVPIRDLGETSYILSVPLPPGMWPAEWFWLESRAEQCGPLGWLFPIYSESAPMPIDIERARAVAGKPVTSLHDGKTIVRSNSPILPPPTGVAR